MAISAGGHCLDPKWFLVKTKALNETRVHKRLTGAGYEVLFPKINRKSSRHRGLFEMRPLFPTYLFVRFDGDELKTIKYTHGVARVICFGPEPHEVDEEIIAAVRARMNEEGIVKLEPKKVVLSPGQRVKIGEGPFAGLDAIFVERSPTASAWSCSSNAVSSYRLTVQKDSLEPYVSKRWGGPRICRLSASTLVTFNAVLWKRSAGGRRAVSPCFRRPHGR